MATKTTSKRTLPEPKQQTLKPEVKKPDCSPEQQQKFDLAAMYLKLQIQLKYVEDQKKEIGEKLKAQMSVGEKVTVTGQGYVEMYAGGKQIQWTEEGNAQKKLFEIQAKKNGWASDGKKEDYVKGYPNKSV